MIGQIRQFESSFVWTENYWGILKHSPILQFESSFVWAENYCGILKHKNLLKSTLADAPCSVQACTRLGPRCMKVLFKFMPHLCHGLNLINVVFRNNMHSTFYSSYNMMRGLAPVKFFISILRKKQHVYVYWVVKRMGGMIFVLLVM